jgi:hypothetical protein
MIIDALDESQEEISDFYGDLLSSLWFERSWVLQEAVLATNEPMLFVGRHSVKLIALLDLFKMLIGPSIPSHIRNQMQSLGPRIRLYHGPRKVVKSGDFYIRSPAERLSLLLKLTQECKATLPHDNIYALLPIVNPHGSTLPRDFVVDYSLPYEQTYFRFAKEILRSTGDLFPLATSQNPMRNVLTWVPDFQPSIIFGSVPPRGEVLIEGDRLHVKGIKVGTIGSIYGPDVSPTGIRLPFIYHSRQLFEDYEDEVLLPATIARNCDVNLIF